MLSPQLMLSILLPIYNFKIIELVHTLHRQCALNQIEFEILCFDDHSEAFKKENQVISQLPNVSYQELAENLGRAKIRNLLGLKAKYDYLLFLDCDSKVVHENYIKIYLEKLNPKHLLFGGRVYSPTPPSDSEYSLHYYFGKNREEILAEENKILKNNLFFMSNNFIIPKKIFMNIQFEESIEGYGHEDTLFGLELQRRKIPIIYLNNPLEHLGLERRAVFLAKQRQAIKNLYQIHQKETSLETKLLKTFVWCKKWQLQKPILLILNSLYPFICKKLEVQKPNLYFLDLYKLHYLLKIDQSK